MPHAIAPSLLAVSPARRGAVVRVVAAALAVGIGGLATEGQASLVLPGSLASSSEMASEWENASWTHDAEQDAASTAPTPLVLELPRPQNDWEALLAHMARLKPSQSSHDAGSGPMPSGGSVSANSAIVSEFSVCEEPGLTGRVTSSGFLEVAPGFRVDLLRPPRD